MLNSFTVRSASKAAHTRQAGRWAVVVIAGTCSVLGGCDSRSDTAKKVERSNRDIQMIGGGTGPEGSAEFAKTQYGKVSSDLQGITDEGLAQENAAAQVILAKSQMGLAQPVADEAAAQERDSLNRATVIRSLVGSWASLSVQAEVLSQFDPSEPIAQLKAQVTEKQKLVAEQQKVKADFDAKLSELRSQAQAKMTAAKAEEDAYAGLKEQATKVTAVAAEPILKQAAERKRAADQLRTEGSLLEAQASVLAPQAAEAQLQIDQYQNQIKGFEAATAQLEERANASRQTAEQARSDSQRVAGDLDKLVQELRAQRGAPLTEPYDKAQQQLQQAASTAGKASSAEGGGGSKLTQGVAQQAVGDLVWSRARGQEAYGLLLDSLAKVEPALPKRDEYSKEASEITANRKELLTTAKEAYEAAQSAYAGVRVSGNSREARDAKERLEALSQLLGALAQVADGKAMDLGAAAALVKKDEAPTEGEPAPTPAAEVTGTPAELTAAIEAILAAAKGGDSAALKEHVILAGEPAVTDALWSMQAAGDRLNKACIDKFGKSFQDIVSAGGAALGGAGAMGGPDLASLAQLTAADATVTMKGDQEAEVAFAGSPKPMTFKLVDGTWKLDAELDKLPAEQVAQVSKMAGPLSQAMDETAADIEGGKFVDGQAMMVGFMQKMQAAMMNAQGGGGG